MDIRKLQRVIVNALDDVKAQDIVVYNTKHLTSEFERVIIATGSSNRQTRALGYNVSHEVKEAGGEVIGMEGTDTGEWVLVDCGQAIVHILQPAMREYYNLEEVWGGKKVNVKLNSEILKRRERTKKNRLLTADALCAERPLKSSKTKHALMGSRLRVQPALFVS